MALCWRVEYGTTRGDPLTSRSGGDGVAHWRDLPTPRELKPSWGVVRVHLQHGPYTHVLQGLDNYWLDERTLAYGMFNDPENAAWYEGAQAVAWAWPSPDVCVPLGSADPTPGAHVLRGVMLPDDQARAIGLL